MKNDDIKTLRAAIDDLASHPPETPMEKLRAAMLIAEAEQFLADKIEEADRTRRRTTLPDGYRISVRRPKKRSDLDDEVWSVFFGDTLIAKGRYRQKVCEMAWDHHGDPGLFEA
jgi:hypothetical protein